MPGDVMDRLGRTLLAIELQHGTQKSCAVAYALLIQAHYDDGAEVWRPINEAIVRRWSEWGRDRIKVMAWSIHEGAAQHERQQPRPAAGGKDA